MPLRILLTVVLCAVAIPSIAAPPRVIAVLPINDVGSYERQRSDERVQRERLRSMVEETVRTVAGDVLSPVGYTVLNNETMLAFLADNGVDPEKVCDATCALDAAREIKAAYFVAGSLQRGQRETVAFIRLLETATGRQLGSVVLDVSKPSKVYAEFSGLAPELFAQLLPRQRRAEADTRSLDERWASTSQRDGGTSALERLDRRHAEARAERTTPNTLDRLYEERTARREQQVHVRQTKETDASPSRPRQAFVRSPIAAPESEQRADHGVEDAVPSFRVRKGSGVEFGLRFDRLRDITLNLMTISYDASSRIRFNWSVINMGYMNLRQNGDDGVLIGTGLGIGVWAFGPLFFKLEGDGNMAVLTGGANESEVPFAWHWAVRAGAECRFGTSFGIFSMFGGWGLMNLASAPSWAAFGPGNGPSLGLRFEPLARATN